jgi:hypothetical protein
MQLSCSRKKPARDIEQSEYCMKDEEENIEDGGPHKGKILFPFHPYHYTAGGKIVNGPSLRVSTDCNKSQPNAIFKI